MTGRYFEIACRARSQLTERSVDCWPCATVSPTSASAAAMALPARIRIAGKYIDSFADSGGGLNFVRRARLQPGHRRAITLRLVTRRDSSSPTPDASEV